MHIYLLTEFQKWIYMSSTQWCIKLWFRLLVSNSNIQLLSHIKLARSSSCHWLLPEPTYRNRFVRRSMVSALKAYRYCACLLATYTGLIFLLPLTLHWISFCTIADLCLLGDNVHAQLYVLLAYPTHTFKDRVNCRSKPSQSSQNSRNNLEIAWIILIAKQCQIFNLLAQKIRMSNMCNKTNRAGQQGHWCH